MKYFKKIVGKRIYLSPMNSEDYLKYAEWMNSDVVAKNIGNYCSIVSIESEKAWLEKATAEKYNFAIVDMENDMLIGNISLMKIHEVNRTAELGIFIGDENYHSKGYGSEAIMLILDYAFNHVNLNNIMLKVFARNKRAIKAYEKCGFKTFGVWKESRYFDGKYEDEIYMNITKKEYNNK
ncbi:MAG: GNAT family N-acetyltransferase [Bacilli bacterium]|nr:GNAT family N-acetyltransferase [Bacilli bacterium]